MSGSCIQCRLSMNTESPCPHVGEIDIKERANLNKLLAETLGHRYEIVSRLGAGAFGDVFKAVDTSLDRDVAIKRVRLDNFTDPINRDEVKTRFVREAKLAAKLNHPNIVTIYDIIDAPTANFIIMEYVDGPTLQFELRRKKRLTWDEAINIFSQAADALDHAHRHAIVHRDVTPSNIMIEDSGRVKMADFGTARSETSSNITTTGIILGTPNYMSPEQARGETTIDRRSDLFSLGCILYECLSGEKPFRAESQIATLMRIVNEDPPRLDHESLGLHPDINDVIARALAKDPRARFPSAAELIQALKALPKPETPAKTKSSAGTVPPGTSESKVVEVDSKTVKARIEKEIKTELKAKELDRSPEAKGDRVEARTEGSGPTASKAEPISEKDETRHGKDSKPGERAERPSRGPLLVTRRDPGQAPSFDSALEGSLSENLLAEVIRCIYSKRKTGILHLEKQGKAKRIYFKKGSIVFANSDLIEDRLGEFLIRSGDIDRKAFERASHVSLEIGQRFGKTLVELEYLPADKLEERVIEQVLAIIYSLFDWDNGEYRFEQLEKPVEEDIIVRLSTADTILEGIRHMHSHDTVRAALGSLDRILNHSDNPLLLYQKVSLTPEEGFVLSRVDGTTTVAEAAAISPLGEDETLRCIYGLVAAGVLVLQENTGSRTDRMRKLEKGAVAIPKPEAEIKRETSEKPAAKKGSITDSTAIRDEIAAKHASLLTATHYELLEIHHTASEAEIKQAYYGLIKKYHPDRHHSPALRDAHGLLEELVVKITNAYQMLSDPAARKRYDQVVTRSEKNAGPPSQGPFGPSARLPQAASGSEGSRSSSPGAVAAAHYREGKRRFDDMSYFDAIQCLEQAVHLDPRKAPYHALLAQALSKNPHWRKEAEEHFLKAIELDSTNVECYLGLAEIYDHLGLSTRAHKMYANVLKLDPGNTIANEKLNGSNKGESSGLKALRNILKKKKA